MGTVKDKKKVTRIIQILQREYPDAKIVLRFKNPLELLVSTVLAAQCTDVKVNQITQDLFKKYSSAKDYARVDLNELEEDIRPTGFFRNKAKAIKGFSTDLEKRFKGKVPSNLDDLVSLPGVGRKTANLVLGEAFGIPGIVVDTHFLRLAKRIGLTENSDPTKVEFDLMEIVPRDQWTRFSHLLTHHGRTICIARKPKHQACVIVDLCKEGIEWKKRVKEDK